MHRVRTRVPLCLPALAAHPLVSDGTGERIAYGVTFDVLPSTEAAGAPLTFTVNHGGGPDGPFPCTDRNQEGPPCPRS